MISSRAISRTRSILFPTSLSSCHPSSSGLTSRRPTYEQNIQALARLERSLESHLNGLRHSTRESAQKLYDSIRRFRPLLDDSRRGLSALALLDKSLMPGLPMLLERLGTSLQPSLVEGPSSLPLELRRQYVSADGRFRVQVFPRDNVTNLSIWRDLSMRSGQWRQTRPTHL